jgi:hypothetical protein
VQKMILLQLVALLSAITLFLYVYLWDARLNERLLQETQEYDRQRDRDNERRKKQDAHREKMRQEHQARMDRVHGVSGPHEVLGVTRNASQREISAAYLRMARKHHPDKNPGDPGAAQRFKEMQRAFDSLHSPAQRTSAPVPSGYGCYGTYDTRTGVNIIEHWGP